MATFITMRRQHDLEGRANAASRREFTLPHGEASYKYKGVSALEARHQELCRRLDALHANGQFTGQEHQHLCEAICVIERGLSCARRTTEPYGEAPDGR